MPTSLNGYYYLVLITDGYDVIDEYDETNNYFFFTDDYGDPIPINNGVIDDTYISSKGKSKKSYSKPGKYANSPSPTAISKRNVNTYSPKEIMNMLKTHKKIGELQRKINQYLKTTSPKSIKVKFRNLGLILIIIAYLI